VIAFRRFICVQLFVSACPNLNLILVYLSVAAKFLYRKAFKSNPSIQIKSTQRVTLRSATGSAFSSDLAALQVSCNVLPLQLHRDMFTGSALQRITRLGSRHPLHVMFCHGCMLVFLQLVVVIQFLVVPALFHAV
jgi:hypothetical protein